MIHIFKLVSLIADLKQNKIEIEIHVPLILCLYS